MLFCMIMTAGGQDFELASTMTSMSQPIRAHGLSASARGIADLINAVVAEKLSCTVRHSGTTMMMIQAGPCEQKTAARRQFCFSYNPCMTSM